MNNNTRSFAVVCAAGKSRRMGKPKLLLPWRGEPIIGHVLRAWTESRVTRTVVVVRPDDVELVDQCRQFDVDVVFNDLDSPHMRSSVDVALDWIEATHAPAGDDVWLLTPADVVQITMATIHQVLDAHDPRRPAIVVPVHNGQRGHPVLLPWPCAAELKRFAPNVGVNAFVAGKIVRELDCGDPAVLGDLDTVADYRRLQEMDHEGTEDTKEESEK
jgi:molybdenum cofactor cytidylyltransferase